MSKGDKATANHKIFSLRSINPSALNSREDVRTLIQTQLEEDIVPDDFDVGFISGTTIISIRSKADLQEFWGDVRMGKKALLWCDGLRDKHSVIKKKNKVTSRQKKRKGSSEAEFHESGCESDDEDVNFVLKRPVRKKRKGAAQEEREERVQETIKVLKEKHGTLFTPMQIRVWSEMVAGDLHSSLDEPPTTSMFVRAGDGGTSNVKKKSESSALTDAFTQAAVALSSALSPSSRPHSNSPTSSPAKLIEA